MNIDRKSVTCLVPEDLKLHPVWEFTNDDEEAEDETIVRPVAVIPVSSLANRIVGTRVRLASGGIVWAMLGNIDLQNSERTYHFRTVSIFHETQWFFLARYHDHDYQTCGPLALGASLGLKMEDIFPMIYDIKYCCIGDISTIVGEIEAEYKIALTRSEILALLRS